MNGPEPTLVPQEPRTAPYVQQAVRQPCELDEGVQAGQSGGLQVEQGNVWKLGQRGPLGAGGSVMIVGWTPRPGGTISGVIQVLEAEGEEEEGGGE